MTIIEALVQLRNDLKLWVANNLRMKVDKEDGKGLSSNDYTDEDKNIVTRVDGAQIKPHKPAIDMGLSPIRLEINNLIYYREDFETFNIVSLHDENDDELPVLEDTEILIGTVHFSFSKGYVINMSSYFASAYNNDSVYFEMRCGNIVHRLTNNYTIDKYNPLWGSDFANKTYEVYIIIKKDCKIEDLTLLGLNSVKTPIYEYADVKDVPIDTVGTDYDFIHHYNDVIKNNISDGTLQTDEVTINGVTFTPNISDKTVLVNGTATTDIEYEFYTNFNYLSPNNFIFKNNDDSTRKGYYFVLKHHTTGKDGGDYDGKLYILSNESVNIINERLTWNDVCPAGYYKVLFIVKAGQSFNNLTLSFIISSINSKIDNYDDYNDRFIIQNTIDNTDLLYNTVIEDRLGVGISYKPNDIFVPNIESSQTIGGITLTVNEDNSITLNGTSNTENGYICFNIWEIPDSLYKYGVIVSSLPSDTYLNSIIVAMSDTTNITSYSEINSDYRIYAFSKYYQKYCHNLINSPKYLNIIITSNNVTYTNVTIKPIIYKCEPANNIIQEHEEALDNKVDKIEGKGLSSNDLTDEAVSLLVSILRSASYGTDQSENISNLEQMLVGDSTTS